MTPPDAVDLRPLVAGAVTWLRVAGLDPGERIVTLLPNTPDTLALSLACMLEGVVQVPLPAGLPAGDVAEIVLDADPVALCAPDAGADVAGLGPRVVAPPAEGFVTLPATDAGAEWPRTRPMAYTSGTTGRRKGVWVGVHEASWGREVVDDEHDAFDRRHGDVHLVVSPLYHSGPLRFATVSALLGGRVAVLPSFDAAAWRDTLRAVRPTSLFCVPTQLRRLLALDDLRPDDLASLDLLAHAGAPCPVPLKRQVIDLAPPGSVWEFYGSTEGRFTVCPPSLWQQAPGSVGAARPGRHLEIRPAAEGGDAGVGTVWVRSPRHAAWRYFRAPQRTAQAWDGDAFTVGDLGHLDDVDGAAVLTLDGRPGDLVITGGVNVYPAEVERHLLDHPGVAEAAVFGVPDDDWGERLVAAVVPWPGHDLDGEQLRAWARQRLAGARVPKRIRVVDDLPRTPTGKVRRVGLASALDLG